MVWKPCRPAEARRGVRAGVLLVIMFAASAIVTRFLCTDDSGYSSFWPANAAILAAMLTLPARRAAAVTVACAAINYFINTYSAYTPSEALLTCLLNIAQPMAAAPLTRRFCGARTDLTHPRRFAAFAGVALFTSGLEAGVGVTIENVFLHDPAAPLAEWVQWTFCDALGLTLATSPLLQLARSCSSRGTAYRMTTNALTGLVPCLALTVLSFVWAHSPLFLFLYPALAWLAFRASPAAVLTSIFFVAILASAFTAHGFGPIARLSPDGRLMREDMLQPFLFSLLLAAIPVNNAVKRIRENTRRLLRMKEHLEYIASHDALTSTMNRKTFETTLRLMVTSRIHGVLLFIDVDNFKAVNDNLGHHAGDEFLRAFCARISSLTQDRQGCAGRFGGDEFALVVPGEFSIQQLDAFCETICRALREPYNIAGALRVVTASIGAVTMTPGGHSAEVLMRKADTALYTTKASGRDGYTLFEKMIVAGETPPALQYRRASDRNVTA
ncbi:diguanylate cyclase domain-containing protein [Acetobacter nitrogenifigens]|nr:diguanylate cyclase [Acetobacter nitrogenifigens]